MSFALVAMIFRQTKIHNLLSKPHSGHKIHHKFNVEITKLVVYNCYHTKISLNHICKVPLNRIMNFYHDDY